MRFLIRTAVADPLPLVPAIRGRLAAVEPDEPIFDAFTMDQVLYEDTASEYILWVLIAVIALIGPVWLLQQSASTAWSRTT